MNRSNEQCLFLLSGEIYNYIIKYVIDGKYFRNTL